MRLQVERTAVLRCAPRRGSGWMGGDGGWMGCEMDGWTGRRVDGAGK